MTMTFRLANISDRAALVDDDNAWYDLERLTSGALPFDPMLAIADPDGLHAASATLAVATPDGLFDEALDAGLVGSPVPRPRNSIAIGLNYVDHAAESNMEPPRFPLTFTKFPSCIVGPRSNVELNSAAADWEVELVVVIGDGGRNIAAVDAWNHIVGVTVGQDISDRQLQFAAKPPHFDLGKSRDTYGPMGPVLVSTDSFDDVTDLAITCDINGTRRQDARTSELIFSVADLVEYLSSILTLSTGDVIFTGTPSGVGAATRTFLKPGDEIVSTIEGIGTLVNRCH